MKKIHNLGDFEQVLLLAILRLKTDGAYGVSIRREICERTERNPTPGAIYTTLDRLGEKGLVRSLVGEATPERGGRAKRYYSVTTLGLGALQKTQGEYQSLLQGLNILEGFHA
jgi:PadR family transcriptional regulator, regulatory protein PadR